MDSFAWDSFVFDAQVAAEPGVAPLTKQRAEESSELFQCDVAYPRFLSTGDYAFGRVGEFPSHYFDSLDGIVPFLSEASPMIPVDDVSDDMMRFFDYSSEDTTSPAASPSPASPQDSASPALPQDSVSPTLPQDSASPAYLSQPTPTPSMSTLSASTWDYSDLEAHIAGDPALVTPFNVIMDKISRFEMPNKDDFLQFVVTKRGHFSCAIEGCLWYEKGWKREDRGTAHVKKEHFRLLSYECTDCDRVYKWPHDLTKHQRLKHPQEGEAPPTKFACPEPNCHKSFTKSSNLTRHRRKVHRRPAGAARRNARKCH